MTFINQYTKHESYTYSKEFIESRTSYIYALGKSKDGGAICKIDTNGNIVWEKSFSYNIKEPLALQKIIQLNVASQAPKTKSNKALGTQYIIQARSIKGHFLISINTNGTVNWVKKITWKYTNFDLFIDPLTPLDSIYGFHILLTNNVGQNFYGKIDGYGNFVFGKDIRSKLLFKIKAIHAHDKGLSVAGETVGELVINPESNIKKSKEAIINISVAEEAFNKTTTGVVFDIHGTGDRISINTAYKINKNLNIHDLQFDYRGTGYFISGYLIKEQALFIGNINEKSNFKLLHKTNLNRSQIQLHNNGIYLLQPKGFQGVLHSLDINFNINWSKELRFKIKENGLSNFTYNKLTDKITANSNGLVHATVIHTNNVLDSCKSFSLNQTIKSIPIKISNFIINLKSENITLNDINLAITVPISKKIEFCPAIDPGDGSDTDTSSPNFAISPNTELQSSHIYMQAAGSTGNDGSVKGMHLRWIFKNYLGQTHLPKGNYANTTNHFNKENDFVKIYRAPYISVQTTLDFSKPANVIDNSNNVWMYTIHNKQFYIYFRNVTKYNQVLSTINPRIKPLDFLESYGSELIEVEHKTELSFRVLVISNNANSVINIESLSVDSNIITATKHLSSRNSFTGHGNIEEENIRSVRYSITDGIINKIIFELYSEVLETLNKNQNLEYLGSFSLTQNDSIATNRLEPTAGIIHGNWPRFNGEDKVNTANYIERWEGNENHPYKDQPAYYEYFDRNLKTTVKRYIQLSDIDTDNPQAIEGIPFSDALPDGVDNQDNDLTNISNLNMLNLASMDFHTARMLGLGHIDTSLDTANTTQEYFYLAEYTTLANITNGQMDDNAVEKQHIYLSLPTAISEERLPYPLDLIAPVNGIVRSGETSGQQSQLDDQRYSSDGKSKFISLFLDELPENPTNIAFFAEETTFSTSKKTIPVFAGIEYRKVGNDWNRPELSNTNQYQNYPGTATSINETVPLLLPEPNEVLFIHREREYGTHEYSSYGVNWFSRSQMSTLIWEVETTLIAKKKLLAPLNIKALLIVEEEPLMLSSAEEQDLFDAVSDTDKTFIRITYDYHIIQDLITYQVNADSMGSYTLAQISDNSFDNSNGEYNQSIFPDNKEIFADEVEIFFRDRTPRTVAGKIKQILPNVENHLMVVLTENYHQIANDTYIVPEIPTNEFANFIGSIFMFNGDKYIIHQVDNSTVTEEGPKFTLFKKEVSETMLNGTELDPNIVLTIPDITGSNTLFNTIENMATESTWGSNNPFSYKIKIGDNWNVHREIIDDESVSGIPEKILEKSRGVWYDSNIEIVYKQRELYDASGNLQYETDTNGDYVTDANGDYITATESVHLGMYRITSNQLGNLVLNNHPQQASHNVNWHKGIVRIHTQESPTKKRKVLEIVKIENIGSTTENLIIYVFDQGYLDTGVDESGNEIRLNEQILVGTNIEVNLYPSYKIYLYKDAVHNLTETHILPQGNEDMRYTIFGLRSFDNVDGVIHKSKISAPSVMFAQKIIKPETPLLSVPKQYIYATRPDTFGRSTFTLKPTFAHEPHAVIFYRTNEHAILNALYRPETIKQIVLKLKENDSIDQRVNRWQNLLRFTYSYTETFQTDGQFFIYPENVDGYRFPNPDKKALFQTINDIIKFRYKESELPLDTNDLFDLGDDTVTPETIGERGSLTPFNIAIPAIGTYEEMEFVEYIKYAIFNAFVPLAEVPLIHQYIKGEDYQPINKKQTIRKDNGDLLSPTDPEFDIAPMAKRFSIDGNLGIQFTDFTLDGTSDNLYFYALRESGSTMQMGDYSPILGPIKLVNTKPPKSPDIKRVMPVLENTILAIKPGISVEINAYPSVQNIKQIRLYRTLDSSKALAIRSMQLIKTIDLTTDNQITNNIWTVKDEFEDLGYVPYSDPLYYRITALREVEYVDKGSMVDGSNLLKTEYAPSIPSKLLISTVVESSNPESPTLHYNFDVNNDTTIIDQVILKWEKKVYNGKYHVYKMNTQGNWVKIHELSSNLDEIQVLLTDTSLADGTLQIENTEGKPLYHHFKVLAENSVGMLSTQDKIMTIPNTTNIDSNEGIDNMIIENTNIVR